MEPSNPIVSAIEDATNAAEYSEAVNAYEGAKLITPAPIPADPPPVDQATKLRELAEETR